MRNDSTADNLFFFFGLQLKLGWHFCEAETPLKISISATDMQPNLKKPGLHTQYQAYNLTRIGLLAQYTTLYHIPLSALLQSYESGFCGSFPRPCVSLEWCFGAISGHGPLVLILRGWQLHFP